MHTNKTDEQHILNGLQISTRVHACVISVNVKHAVLKDKIVQTKPLEFLLFH